MPPIDELQNEALVIRGGRNTPETFIRGSGVTITEAGTLLNVSVNCAAVAPIAQLAATLPHSRIGVTPRRV